MFEKMIFATDLSEASNSVAQALGGLRKLGAREVLLLHCLNLHKELPGVDQVLAFTRPLLKQQEKMLAAQGFETRPIMARGSLRDEIHRLADEHGCSLIVVGARGESVSTDVTLGSMAAAVIESARLPVLIMRLPLHGSGFDEQRAAWACECLRHVLFATDFSDHAEHAFPYVRHLAGCGAKRITLLHVRHDPHHDASADALAEIEQVDMDRLRRREAGLLADGAGEVVSLIRRGSPKHGILHEIAGQEVSLAVLGRQGHGALDSWLPGSVSQAVARASTAPVLLVPMPR